MIFVPFLEKVTCKEQIEVGHEGKKILQCSICDKRFPRKTNLNRHNLLVHDYQCNSCDKKFAIKMQLKKHKLLVHGEEKFKCEICKINCFTDQNLQSHIESVHDLDKCRLCKKEFKNLDKHFAIFHQGYGNFGCEIFKWRI